MIITKDYLDRHKTPKGAWTKKQFEAIGIRWPPSKDWLSKVIGTRLTPELARVFETSNQPKKRLRS